jgi:uncharacterized cupredoxin-like copper-binding protein
VAAAVAVSAAAAAPKPTKLVTTTVKVTMHDFSFSLSRNSVPKGKVIFIVTNRGATAHDFVLSTQNKKTPVIQPGTTTKLVVLFPKAGKFLYLCSVGEHFLHGMKGYLIVK